MQCSSERGARLFMLLLLVVCSPSSSQYVASSASPALLFQLCSTHLATCGSPDELFSPLAPPPASFSF